jgi:serine/threonine protein kinase
MSSPKDPLSLVSTELAGYQISEEIGRGGMATVYRAYQAQLERWVAIKVLHPSLSTNAEILTRFRREAKAVAALRHPNVLTIYDYGEEQERAYIVMEYVAGGTLKEHQGQWPWTWSHALSLLIPVGQALAYAHSRGIVHRDIKPGNILLPREDWPLLSDFGLIKLLKTRKNITLSGVGVGTPRYTAPEQLVGKVVDHRADIYALGLVLYEMVTGRLPFKSDALVKMMAERLNQPPLPARQFNQAVPPQLEDVLMRALARQPEERFAHTEELVEALREVERTAPVESDATHSTQVIRRDRLAVGPRLSVAGTGIPMFLPPKRDILIGRSVPHGDKVPDIDFSDHGGGRAGVSRIHASLSYQGKRWYLGDLGSTNGTFVNEKRVLPDQPVEVKDGDCIRFGSMNVTLHVS